MWWKKTLENHGSNYTAPTRLVDEGRLERLKKKKMSSGRKKTKREREREGRERERERGERERGREREAEREREGVSEWVHRQKKSEFDLQKDMHVE